MDFRLSDEQRLLCESARSLLRRESEPAHVKEVERSEAGFDARLWRHAGELGWLELAADPQNTLDCALLAEELGRASAPLPFLSTALVARALLRGSSDAARERWLSALLRAERIGTVAIAEPAARFDVQGIATRADTRGGHLLLEGSKAFVADGLQADLLLVAAHVAAPGQAPAPSQLTLLAVDATAEGIVRRAVEAGPGVPLASVTLEGVRVGDGDVVAPPGEGAAAIREIVIDAAVLGSAFMLGHAAAACDAGVEYAKTREQFGVPIGSFQAVQHRLADMATDVATLRALVYAAAWKRSRDEPDVELAASTAKAWGAEVLERTVTGAHQVFAGIGYTDEHDIQLHTRRAPWYAAMFGDTRSHYARSAQLLGL
jgi:alkylation response protein AidB-like acyl-CoA dehydrogenase